MTQTLWFLGARFNIIADATTTKGKYDLIEAYFPPDRQTAPHLHTRYSEQITCLKVSLRFGQAKTRLCYTLVKAS